MDKDTWVLLLVFSSLQSCLLHHISCFTLSAQRAEGSREVTKIRAFAHPRDPHSHFFCEPFFQVVAGI